ncbi:MAG: HAMP domain-containing histidine kinase, partial [Lachnospiraceae bacterium]|nr:HAMP domain-containing histidine kinase [Lachnospiraceae bacterium]
MIKKMRWRVILAAMVAFFLVIALIATLVNVFNYYSVSRRADQTIEFISGYEKRTPPEPKGEELPKEPGGDNLPKEPPMMMPNVEDNYMTRFFVVRVDSDLNVLSASTDFIATVSEESAHQFAEKALSKSADKGYISDYRYSKETVDGNTIIIFLNVSREIQYMRSLRFLTIIVSGVSLLLVFVLVFLLSGRAVRPLARNIEQQKQFITDASHELKTPLTSISTSIDVISMEHGDDEWTENIKSQTKRMSKLVSELVTLSRLDEEKPLPEKKQFSLSDAAWEIVDVYKPQAKAQNKTFEADIANEVSVVGDKTAIQQMLSV